MRLKCPRCSAVVVGFRLTGEGPKASPEIEVWWSRAGVKWRDLPLADDVLDPAYGCGYCGGDDEAPTFPTTFPAVAP